MSDILVSGSSAGLGLMSADPLVGKGRFVALHARNAKRAEAYQQMRNAHPQCVTRF